MKMYEAILDILEKQGPVSIPLICEEMKRRTNVMFNKPAHTLEQSYIQSLIKRNGEIFLLKDGIVSIRPERDPVTLLVVWHSYPGPEIRLKADFKRNTFTYFEWNLDLFASNPLKVKQPGNIENFKKLLYLMHIWDWKEDYQAEGIIVDGDSWSVMLETKGFIYESGGLNDFPENWNMFTSAISLLIGKPFPG